MKPRKNLCACGCGSPTTKTWALGHHRRLANPYTISDSGCWVWNGKPDYKGYCMIYRNGRTYKAHRWMYEQHVGPIPDGLQLDHLCRNRACVNPAHLEPVTNAENQWRGDRAKLTWEQVEEIRSAPGRFYGCNDFARRFGVAPMTITCARTGRSWRESHRGGTAA